MLAGAAVVAVVVVAAGVLVVVLTRSGEDGGATSVTTPPVHAGVDYQIGGAYDPPPGVGVVIRDHAAQPAAGLYNICYVNAFQAQPDAEDEWGDLLLRNAGGDVVMDEEWGEALLDIRTDDKRRRVADKVDGWIDDCAARGYRGVEPDNYDSFSRSQGLLDTDDAQAYIRLLSAHAHEKGLAVAQKNTVELAGDRVRNGLDFAVAEECGQYDECAEYATAFRDHVIVIEYTKDGLSRACADFRDRLSIVRRDLDVLPAGSAGYVHATC